MSPTQPLTTFFRRRNFCASTAATPYADLLERSSAFGTAPALGRSEEQPYWDLTFETRSSWTPRRHVASALAPEPERYVDGAARATLLGWGLDDSSASFAAVVGGAIGAMAGRIERRRLVTEPPVLDGQHATLMVSLGHTGFPNQEIDAIERDLTASPVRFELAPRITTTDLGFGVIEAARVSAHTRITEAMQRLERAAIRGSSDEGAEPPCLTIVDGALGSHLTENDRHLWPLVGVVKRHAATDLPYNVFLAILSLRIGQRTPAMLIEPRPSNNRPPMVTWYQKIRGDRGTALNGVIRVETSLPFLEEVAPEGRTTEWIDAMASHVLEARAVRDGYSREDCSLQPVIVLEDRLHALSGDMETIRHTLMRLLDIPEAGMADGATDEA